MITRHLFICLWAAIPFFTFLLTCASLLESRFTKRVTILITLVFLTGIISLQVGGYLYSKEIMLVLTMLPLTAYLPVIICVYILSKSGFFQTSSIWTIAILVSSNLEFFRKAMIKGVDNYGMNRGVVISVSLIMGAIILLWIVNVYMRKAFQSNVLHNDTNWLPLCFPTIMIFISVSYFKNTPTNSIVWLILFLTALSVFFIISRVLILAQRTLQMKEDERVIAQQLKIQRQEYESICKKVEQGRSYRHDMRHHLMVLNTLASNENSEEIKQYIARLDEHMKESELVQYCENKTVNAVISSYISQAKELGYNVQSNVLIPSEMLYDEMDICIILANALENAIHAIQETNSPEASIQLKAVLEDEKKFIIVVKNTYDKTYTFDKEGLPIVEARAGHGIGLRSIKAITEKYQGILQGACTDGSFQLKVMLFEEKLPALSVPEKIKRTKKASSATLASMLFLCLAFGGVGAIYATDGENIFGSFLQVSKADSISAGWGATQIHIEIPEVKKIEDPNSKIANANEQTTDTQKESTQKVTTAPSQTISWEDNKSSGGTIPPIVEVEKPTPPSPEKPKEPVTPVTPVVPDTPDVSEGVDEINQKMEAYVETLREKYVWYVARKYEGYVAMDTKYTTVRNDGELLIIRFESTLNVGGSQNIFRHFMLDMKTGNVIELKDLFTGKYEYVNVISEEILSQMKAQVDAGLANYFIPGDMWPESDWFKYIARNQDFYINDQNQLVIIFEEYEVAPGNAGCPEFVIPTSVLTPILSQPTILK